MQWLEKFQKKIISDSFRIVSDEVNFFIYDYHPENEWQEETINKASNNLIKLSIAGTCLGISLSLSMRRYIPSLFSEMSVWRLLQETTFVMVGYGYFAKLGTIEANQNLSPLKKELLMKNSNVYLQFLVKRAHKYPHIFRTEREIFRSVLSQSEYEEWRKNSKIDVSLFLDNTVVRDKGDQEK